MWMAGLRPLPELLTTVQCVFLLLDRVDVASQSGICTRGTLGHTHLPVVKIKGYLKFP